MKSVRRLNRLGGSTWSNPLRVAQYAGVSLLYFLGLIAFHTYTGVFNEVAPPSPGVSSGAKRLSSDDAREFLRLGQAEKALQGSRWASAPPFFRKLLQVDEISNVTKPNNLTILEEIQDPLFPEDLFTEEQRDKGAVALHILGVVYMFIALAIVCDEFFVPSLDVIIEVIGCSEDVAGATFMAAGGSAPELFTSVIGVFVAFSDVGIGTIVGSAVFNILFVIGMCALFSKTVLHLTWWPLFRDCTFYSISLITLIIFFRDEQITWYESLLLLMEYASYVFFMKYNVQAERFVKKILYKNKVTRVRSTDHLMPPSTISSSQVAPLEAGTSSEAVDSELDPTYRRASNASLSARRIRRMSLPAAVHVMVYRGSVAEKRKRQGSAGSTIPEPRSAAAALAGVTGAAMSGVVAGEPKGSGIPVLHSGTHFRHGLLQLMIHTIDPLHDGKVDEKATQLHAIASLKVLLDETKPKDGIEGSEQTQNDSGRASQGTEVLQVDALTNAEQLSQLGQQNGHPMPSTATHKNPQLQQQQSVNTTITQQQQQQQIPNVEDENQPLDLSWPDTWRERITYIIFLPIIVPLWLTLPDPRKPEARKFFPITFFGSILWIAAFSYLMVWWATVTGDTFEIPPPVMGLTFLAAGTSIPDLITSVIVARKGFGDMAVSSSVGSNIFDVTVGLPLPWFLYGIIFRKPVPVSAAGMVCSITILFGMLILVFFSILIFNWQMTKKMGFLMFILYFGFVIVSLGFEYEVYSCPI